MAASSSDNWQSGKTLSESASFMLANKIATDVTFKFPNTDETVQAHCFVLMAKSHVPFVMFNSVFNRPGDAIAMSYIEPAIFKESIKSLYTDESTLSLEEVLQFSSCTGKNYKKLTTATLSQSASFLLQHQMATDVTFTFPNSTTTLEAHRFVLMARSHVFCFMFSSCLEKSALTIEISDIAPLIFDEFLNYLYTDEPMLSAEKGVQCVLQLIYCAEKYEVTHLKAKCIDYLKTQTVNRLGLAMVLDHAVIHNDEALISTCRDIIEEHHVTRETMQLVLGFPGLVELTLFKFCNAWAEQECTRRGLAVDGGNKREMLGPLLQKIPFCSMTLEEFATNVPGEGLLTGEEELQVLRYFCAADKSNPPFPCKTIPAQGTLQL